MLLIVEIMLSVSAWKKGWRGWVILPWAVLLTAVMALSGGAANEDEAFAIGLGCDVVLILVLAAMTATVHGNKTEATSQNQTGHEAVHVAAPSPSDRR